MCQETFLAKWSQSAVSARVAKCKTMQLGIMKRQAQDFHSLPVLHVLKIEVCSVYVTHSFRAGLASGRPSSVRASIRGSLSLSVGRPASGANGHFRSGAGQAKLCQWRQLKRCQNSYCSSLSASFRTTALPAARAWSGYECHATQLPRTSDRELQARSTRYISSSVWLGALN